MREGALQGELIFIGGGLRILHRANKLYEMGIMDQKVKFILNFMSLRVYFWKALIMRSDSTNNFMCSSLSSLMFWNFMLVRLFISPLLK